MSNKPLSRRGLLLVLSSPSGAGKTTISRALLQGDDNLALSVCTDGGKKLRVRRIDTCASMGAHRSCPSQQLIAWGLHR